MIPNSSLIVSSTEPTDANRKKIWIKYKNILSQSENDWEQGTISSVNGENADSTTRIRTVDFIEVNSNTEYILNTSNCMYFIYEYTSDGTYIKVTPSAWGTDSTYKYISSDTTNKIKIVFAYTDNSTIETSIVSTIKATLSDIKSAIYVKNDNGVYEEFMKQEDTGWVDCDMVEGYTGLKARVYDKILYIVGNVNGQLTKDTYTKVASLPQKIKDAWEAPAFDTQFTNYCRGQNSSQTSITLTGTSGIIELCPTISGNWARVFLALPNK